MARGHRADRSRHHLCPPSLIPVSLKPILAPAIILRPSHRATPHAVHGKQPYYLYTAERKGRAGTHTRARTVLLTAIDFQMMYTQARERYGHVRLVIEILSS